MSIRGSEKKSKVKSEESQKKRALGESHRVGWGVDQARVPPLREPTRSQEANAKKRRGLASVGMSGFVWGRTGRLGQGSVVVDDRFWFALRAHIGRGSC
jgi:hypothetical protein